MNFKQLLLAASPLIVCFALLVWFIVVVFTSYGVMKLG